MIRRLGVPIAAALAACLHLPAAAEIVALTGATVHTASQGTLPNATVVFDGDRIVAVGSNVTPPAGARIVVATGKHVWPGYVSAFTTLGLTEVSSVSGTNDQSETGTVNPNVRAEVAINPDSELLPVTRVNGVTSALVVPRGGVIAGTSAILRLDGWNQEDMTVRAPVGLHVNWPSMAISRSPFETRNEEEQKKDRERRLGDIRQAFDDARAYLKARDAREAAGVPRHDQDVKWESMRRALQGEIPVMFHAAALNQIEAVLKFADEQELKNVVLVDGYDAWRVADELKRRNIPVILGESLELPRRSWEPYDMAMNNAARLQQAGVQYCLSDAGGTHNARHLSHQAAFAAAYGLSREEALRSITLYPARILGVGDRFGSIEVGKAADLVLGDGDPLEMTTKVEQVWIAGKAISMENRQTRLFQKYDSRPRGAKARPR